MTRLLAGLAVALALATPAVAAPVTRASMMEELGRHFERADADGDGQVTRAELNRAIDAKGGALARMPRDQRQLLAGFWFMRADADGNGRVSLAESRKLAGGLFAGADTDGDGRISTAERDRAEKRLKARTPAAR